jgi:hypothetical protein
MTQPAYIKVPIAEYLKKLCRNFNFLIYQEDLYILIYQFVILICDFTYINL